MIILIAAIDNNRVIGKDNQLLWHLPNDLKRFKALTSSYPIIMGKNTYLSLGKPLPNRTNIVVSSTKDWKKNEDILLFNHIQQAIDYAKTLNDNIYIIGGGKIYEQTINLADRLEITKVYANLEGDTFFPPIDEKIWKPIEIVEHKKDEKHPFDYTFITYMK